MDFGDDENEVITYTIANPIQSTRNPTGNKIDTKMFADVDENFIDEVTTTGTILQTTLSNADQVRENRWEGN